MSWWKLWTQDLCRGRHSTVSSTPDVANSAKNAVDGDPASLYAPGATAANWRYAPGGVYTIAGFGIANHNLKGATLAFYRRVASVYELYVGSIVVGTKRDFIVPFATPCSGGDAWEIRITGGPAAGIQVGVISLLVDRAYDEDGDLTSGSGYGAITLSDEAAGLESVQCQDNPGIVFVEPAHGPAQAQRLGVGYEDILLTTGPWPGNEGGAFWKLRNAVYPRWWDDSYVNAGLAKGAWLTDDQVDSDDTAQPARYVRGAPGTPLRWQPIGRDGRVVAQLALRTVFLGG